jgi:hypothetical protein
MELQPTEPTDYLIIRYTAAEMRLLKGSIIDHVFDRAMTGGVVSPEQGKALRVLFDTGEGPLPLFKTPLGTARYLAGLLQTSDYMIMEDDVLYTATDMGKELDNKISGVLNAGTAHESDPTDPQ